MRDHVDRAKVADRDLAFTGIKGDLGAEVGTVHDARMLLRRADVARILEGDPGMAGLEQHREHLAPEGARRNGLEQLEFAAGGLALVLEISLLKGAAVLVVKIGTIDRREQRPAAVLHYPFHEQIGDPVGGVHVVSPTPVVTGVLAQFEKLLDVEVPGLEIGADRAFALAALIDRDRGVVDDLQEGYDTLALAVGAFDVAAQGTHRRPVITQTAGVLGKQCVLLDGLVDAVKVIGDRRQVAGRQLRAQCSRIEQCGRRAHEIEAREEFVELDRSRLTVDFIQRQTHRDPHEKGLRQLDAPLVDMQEISIVEGLQTKVGKLVVAIGTQCLAKTLQIELPEAGIEQPCLDTALDEARKVFGVTRGHAGLVDFVSEHFATNRVQQKARSDKAVGRIGLDQRPGRENRGFVDLVERNAVIDVLERLDHHHIGPHSLTQAQTGGCDQRMKLTLIERPNDIAIENIDPVFGLLTGRRGLSQARRTLLRPLFAVENIGPGDLMLT